MALACAPLIESMTCQLDLPTQNGRMDRSLAELSIGTSPSSRKALRYYPIGVYSPVVLTVTFDGYSLPMDWYKKAEAERFKTLRLCCCCHCSAAVSPSEADESDSFTQPFVRVRVMVSIFVGSSTG